MVASHGQLEELNGGREATGYGNNGHSKIRPKRSRGR